MEAKVFLFAFSEGWGMGWESIIKVQNGHSF